MEKEGMRKTRTEDELLDVKARVGIGLDIGLPPTP